MVAAVQTHGAASSALRSIHAPTRDEEGTYIRASVASDLDTLSTPSTPRHQGMMMNIFLLGGWVARPSAFLFLRLRWFLVFCVRLVAMLSQVALSSVFAWLYVVCLAWSLCLTVPSLARVLPCSRA